MSRSELAPPQEFQASRKIVLLPCGSHGLYERSRSRWRLVRDPGGFSIACLERTCRFDVEHRFVQPVGQLRRRKLLEIASVSLIKRDLQAPVALVHDLDHDVIEEPFLDEIPVHLDDGYRTGDRDQPLHAMTPLEG